ncbi:hypothetical protein FSP39_014199 [Pinctada imbricata]|uniref:Methionine aminopeptidase n=1 Tax=Pinctada imbricata TaxID=66713 RepID=A0AA89C7D7_PINIB|nr:hypothetical protein FSP39_014199 [Pinctada imbricata]
MSYSLYRTVKQSIKSLSGYRGAFPKSSLQNHGNRKYDLVLPAATTPLRPVPDYIRKPPYIINEKLDPPRSDIEIKTVEQIQGMRKSCQVARKILNIAATQLKVGMTTDEIDRIIHEECIANNAYPSTLLYRDFPKSVCTSVNNVVCHGIPDLRPLQDGDIINIDVTIYHEGYHGDLSETYLIGSVDEEGQRLVETTRQCRDAAIDICGPGQLFSNIGLVINGLATEAGYNVIPHFCGHGIGSYFHGPPEILHYAYLDHEKLKMEEGMTFTIEPILTEGEEDITVLSSDGWTAVSNDGSRSAQFEHTVLITDGGVEILTE